MAKRKPVKKSKSKKPAPSIGKRINALMSMVDELSLRVDKLEAKHEAAKTDQDKQGSEPQGVADAPANAASPQGNGSDDAATTGASTA